MTRGLHLTMRRSIWVLVAVLGLGCAIAAAVVLAPRPSASGGVPTAVVARGDLRLDVYASGELRAGRSVSLS